MFKKFFNIFDFKEKFLFFLFYLSLIFSAFLELLGIGLVVPLLNSFLSTDGYNNTNSVLNFFNNIVIFIKKDIQNNSLIPLYLFMGVFFIKSLYLLLFSAFQHFFIVKIAEKIFLKTYKTIILQPYNFFINKKVSSSELIATINRDCEISSNSFMVSAALLISDTTFLFLIFLFFFAINFKIAFFVIIFSVLIVFIFKFFSSKIIEKLSIARQKIEATGINHLQNTFLGIREMKLSSKENSFIEVFKSFFYKKVRISSLLIVINQLPRIWIELMSILLATLVILNLNSANIQNDNRELVSIIAVYLVAFIRVTPSLNRIIVHFNSIKYSIPNIKKVVEYLDLGIKDKTQVSNDIGNDFQFKSVSLKNISYSYPNTKNLIFKNTNLNIKKGDIIGLIGNTGVGKSTLVDIVCGFLTPTKGNVYVNKKKITNLDKNWKKKIGYVSQNSHFFNDTIVNNISLDFSKNSYAKSDIKKIKQIIKITQLDNLVSKLTNKLKTSIGESGKNLSGGQRQRIAIARALYNDPEILILDEATIALDNVTEKRLINSIIKAYSNKITIIIISHRNSSLKICQKIYKIINKKIIFNNKK